MMDVINGGGIGLKFQEDGILDSSVHHFAHPSAFAMEHLFYIQSMGRFDVNASYRVNRFNYSSYLLLVPTEGALSCSLEGQTATATPGSVLLLDCHLPHAYRAAGNASFYFLHFGGAMSGELYRLITGRCGLMVSSREPELFAGSIGGLLRARESESEWDEFAASAAVYRLLLSLAADATDRLTQAADQQRMTPVIEYVARHLQDKLSVDTLAGQFGYSAGYLTRLFRRYTGYAPYQYILRTRMDRAKHLLATTELPIQEIADQTGFSSLANFSSAFRKSIGKSPGDFRRQPL